MNCTQPPWALASFYSRVVGSGHGCDQLEDLRVAEAGDGPGEIVVGVDQGLTGLFQQGLLFAVLQPRHADEELGGFFDVELVDLLREDKERVLAHLQGFTRLDGDGVHSLAGVAADLARYQDFSGIIPLVIEGNHNEIIQDGPVRGVDDGDQVGGIDVIHLHPTGGGVTSCLLLVLTGGDFGGNVEIRSFELRRGRGRGAARLKNEQLNENKINRAVAAKKETKAKKGAGSAWRPLLPGKMGAI